MSGLSTGGQPMTVRIDDSTLEALPILESVHQSISRSRPAIALALTNQKGGVGKTTSAVNLATVLAGRGYQVLLIDIDPQGNATSSLGLDKRTLDTTVYDVLVNGVSINDAIISSVRPRLDLLPANASLSGAEVELVEFDGRAFVLKEAVQPIADHYDLIMIDCPPSLGLLTLNALTVVDSVIVPIQCEYLALEGLGQLIATIDMVKQSLNPELDVTGVLMTMYDVRTRLSAHVVEEVRRFFPQRTFKTIVPRSVRLAEAPSYGQTIDEYDPASRGAAAYDHVADELIDRLRLRPVVSNRLTQPLDRSDTVSA